MKKNLLSKIDSYVHCRSARSSRSFLGSSPTTVAVTSYDDAKAMEKLGEWLRDQQVMEETMTILQKEGWMT